MGELSCSDDVLKLALSKCKLNLEETIFMVTNPDAIADMEEEIRREQESNQNLQLMSKAQINIGEQEPEAEDAEDQPPPEKKLNEMISNRTECFDMLFDLLNLGVPDIA